MGQGESSGLHHHEEEIFVKLCSPRILYLKNMVLYYITVCSFKGFSSTDWNYKVDFF